jgi:hypothetical protein
VVDGEGAGQSLEFLELIVSVMSCIFGIDLTEESGVFFNLGDLFVDGTFSGDFF